MSKQHRTKLIKSLEQQLEAATDPKIKADVSRQLTKLLFRPTRKGSSRKPQTTPTSYGKASAIVAKWADRLSHLDEQKRIEFSVVKEVEERQKPGGSSIDRGALIAEVLGMLSAEERTVLSGGSSCLESNQQ